MTRPNQAGMALPKPGDLVQLDFRASSDATKPTERIKVLQVTILCAEDPKCCQQNRLRCRDVQWNIERGYKLEEIVKELKKIDADVIALQEVDIGCVRSSSIDTGAWPTIADKALMV